MVKNCPFFCPNIINPAPFQYSTFAPLSKRSDDKFLKGKWLVKNSLKHTVILYQSATREHHNFAT